MRHIKQLLIFMLLFAVTISGLWAFEGVWGFRTEAVQAIYTGRVLGFAEPDSANKVTVINFVDDKNAVLVYSGKKYQTTYVKEGNALIFESPEFDPPLPIVLLSLGNNTYRFSYTLLDAKEGLSPGQGAENFVNYIGTMIYVGDKLEKE
jgi:hypothetical protein